MSGLLSNPELLRNAWSQLRPKRLLAVATICALLSVSGGCLFFVNSENWADSAKGLLSLVVSVQILALAGGGSIACLNSILREKERNSFDFQRVTRLTSFELAMGKLFGAPLLAYFICLCLMPVSVFAAYTAHTRPSFYVAAYVVLIIASIAFHALSLLMSALSVRGSQTGAIILILLLLWITSYGGGVSAYSAFHLGAMGPFFAEKLISQTSWNLSDLEKSFSYRWTSFGLDSDMIDVLFGKCVHHLPVFLSIDLAVALWFFLAVVRNIKREPAEYEIYSPGQSLAFAFFLGLIFVAFFNWHYNDLTHSGAFALSFDMVVLTLLGLTLLRNRERTRGIVRMRGGATWLDELWPSPWVLTAAVGLGALVILGAVLSHASDQSSGFGFLVFRVLFFALWIARDQQYMQWASLRQGRNPLIIGVLYLVVFYVCASTLLAALRCFEPERIAFTAFFLPSPIYALDRISWSERPAIWVAAYLAQAAIIGFFFYLQRRQIVALAGATPSITN